MSKGETVAAVEPKSGAVDAPLIAGRMEGSIANHERACLVLIAEEERKVAPDNALIRVLCDSVRLGREYAEVQMERLRAARAVLAKAEGASALPAKGDTAPAVSQEPIR